MAIITKMDANIAESNCNGDVKVVMVAPMSQSSMCQILGVHNWERVISLRIAIEDDCQAKGLDLGPVGELSELRELHLNGRGCGDEHLRRIKHIGSLRVLDLHNSGITDNGIASAISHNVQIEELDLSGTDVTDKAFDAIRSLEHLAVLNISHTRQLGCDAIDALGNLKCLRLILVEGKECSRDAVRRLETQNEYIRVIQ